MAKRKAANGGESAWPRRLDAEGCLFGQRMRRDLGSLEDKIDDMEKDFKIGVKEIKGTLNKLILAVLGAALGLAASAIFWALTGGG